MTKLQEPIKIEIPVEEEPAVKAEGRDITNELRNLGQQFANTLEAAWHSQERVRVEGEIREGMKQFADEVGRVLNNVRESAAAQKVREEASEIKTKVEDTEVTKKARNSVAQGLSWLSQELGKLAEKFTPNEKSPNDVQ
ncbi:MAG: hypothetical protein IPL28_06535 [Chloroflexi bacterium]|nr:hypothetical protein [Chloroflexota bacterium]MDA0246450.1 hypothetical protein [Chloroflexota bacterium]